MCPNSAPRPCRAQAQTQRYNRVCESLSWVSSRKKVRETCQTQLTFSDSLSALPSYIVSDTFSRSEGQVTDYVAIAGDRTDTGVHREPDVSRPVGWRFARAKVHENVSRGLGTRDRPAEVWLDIVSARTSQSPEPSRPCPTFSERPITGCSLSSRPISGSCSPWSFSRI